MRYDIVDSTGIDRLFKLIEQKVGHWLAMQIEDSKIELTQVERRSLSLERIEPGLVAELSQVLLEEAIGPLLARIGASVEQLLGQAGLRAGQIDTVFFTGGSSSVPALRQCITALLLNARQAEGNVFGSIGSGLAIEAKKRYG